MDANKFSLGFYDCIAILFPGAGFAALFIHLFSELGDMLIIINGVSSVLFLFIILVISFIGGHITYILSKKFTDSFVKIITCNKFNRKLNSDAFKEIDKKAQNKIILLVERIHDDDFDLKDNIIKYRNNEISGKELNIRNLCYAVVKSEIGNYETFVSLADFLRNTSFILFLVDSILLIEIYIFKMYSFGSVKNLILIALILYSSYQLFIRSIDMRKRADRIVYNEFLFKAKSIKE